MIRVYINFDASIQKNVSRRWCKKILLMPLSSLPEKLGRVLSTHADLSLIVTCINDRSFK